MRTAEVAVLIVAETNYASHNYYVALRLSLIHIFERGGLDHGLGRTDHEAGAGQVDGGPRGSRESAGVGGTGSDELSEATSEWTWRHHRAERTGTDWHRAQHAAHGLGV